MVGMPGGGQGKVGPEFTGGGFNAAGQTLQLLAELDQLVVELIPFADAGLQLLLQLVAFAGAGP